jgi:alkylated DNA repair dioxygenase AlkB
MASHQPSFSPAEAIQGLTCLSEFISNEQEAELLDHIDVQPWITELKRRVQHYGYRYDYKARGVNAADNLGPLPSWLESYANALRTQGIFSRVPDQIIVNEYQPGQGISAHIDCIPCFGEPIASLSLGSACMMDFTDSQSGEKQSLLLQPRSLIILSGDARYHWKHGIAGRKSDRHNGTIIPRTRRISLTFRLMKFT